MDVRKRFLFIFFAFCSLSSYSQGETNNWYFGHKAGIGFNSGSAVALYDGQLSTQEGCATISSKAGKLLFYTDGDTVWNHNHQAMTNGTGLLGHYSSSQSAVIVPRPGSATIYYIFTVSARGDLNGLHYSIVDISLQGGMGEVVQKNTLLFSAPMWEKLNAVRHCNNKDVWVVSRLFRSNSYYAYLVTSAGVSAVPVISNAGNMVTGYDGNSIGIMKCSPDGRKLAAVHSAVDFTELFDFNNQTGVLSNAKRLSVRPTVVHPDELGAYGVEFSADSRYLYISSWYDLFENTYIHQFDASQLTETAIQSSRVRIDSQRRRQYGAMQLAPDGKIYVTENNYNYLSVISNPGNQGAECNFQARSFLLGDPSEHYSQIGLPTFIQSYIAADFKYDFTTRFNCRSLNVDFAINNTSGYDSLKWEFDDSASGGLNNSSLADPTHAYNRQGIYYPRVIIYKCIKNDTVVKKIWAGQVNTFLGNDAVLCEGNTLKLDGTAPNAAATYLWNTGAASPATTIAATAKYWVRVALADCIYSDTINVTFNPSPASFDLGRDTTICDGASLQLGTRSSTTGINFLWSNGSSNPTITVSQDGNYWLKITNQYGCFKTDTINVSTNFRPVFNLGKDTALCEGDILELFTNAAASAYLWNTGETDQSVKVTQTGLYWCEAINNRCVYRDSISIIVNQKPQPNLGPDMEFCGYNPVSVSPNVNGAGSYLWQDSSTSNTLSVNQSGQFWVEVTNIYGCKKRDTANLIFKPYPQFSLGEDREACQGEVVSLAAFVSGGTYLWSTGSEQNQESISTSGVYWLDAELNGCKFRDSVTVRFKSLPPVNLGKDTTLCEGQTLLLDAQNNGSTYLWQDNSREQTFLVSGQGQYAVKVTNENCSYLDTIKIFYSQKPTFTLGPDFGICEGQSIILKPKILNVSGNIQYLWQDGSAFPSITISQPGSYYLAVSNHCGDKTDSVVVTKGVCKLYLPNAFTPNGDGLNDVFRPGFGENVTDFHFDIFNRWGQKVYTSSSIRSGWDGKYNGVLQPNGVYVWIIAFRSGNDFRQQLVKGSVTLIQ